MTLCKLANWLNRLNCKTARIDPGIDNLLVCSTFLQLIHIHAVSCDCHEFCKLVLVVKLLENLEWHF